MTSGLRRGSRRSQSHDLPARVAAFRCHRCPHLGSGPLDLLGEACLREVVALALLLGLAPERGQKIAEQLYAV
jgi:hypothetical protein